MLCHLLFVNALFLLQTSLRKKLEKSERERNDFEMKLELMKIKYQNQNRELIDSLEVSMSYLT